jgi:hypothetical protein
MATQTWWWTVSDFGYCDGCGEPTTGKRIAYEPYLRSVLCESCAFDREIAEACRESKRARRARQLVHD